MPVTTWTDVSDVVTDWTIVTTPHRALGGAGGWGDAFGFFPWGQHEAYEDFTVVVKETGTTWTKIS